MSVVLVKPTVVAAAPLTAPFDRLQSELDLEHLIATRVRESTTIEYKTIVEKPDHNRVAETVSAFANTLGGLVIWGIETGRGSDKNVPVAAKPLPVGLADDIRQAIGANIRHPIDGLMERTIPAASGGEYYLLSVPQSLLASTCATFDLGPIQY